MLLGSLSYEELVEKLVSKEIDALNYNKKGKDLNESERAQSVLLEEILTKEVKDDRKSDKETVLSPNLKEKKNLKRKTKNQKERYSVLYECRQIRWVSKSDLVDFISETAKIRKSDVGDVDLQKKCSF